MEMGRNERRRACDAQTQETGRGRAVALDRGVSSSLAVEQRRKAMGESDRLKQIAQ